MNLTSIKDAAKKAFCGQGGGSVLLRRFGALALALCLLAAIPMDAAAEQEDGPAPTEVTSEPMPIGGSNGDIAIVSGLTRNADEKDRTDLRNFLTGLSITDSEGKLVDPDGGTLYVGEKYAIHLQFGEEGQQSLQFGDDSDALTYQIPKAFKVDPVTDKELKVEVDGREVVIGYYSIDGDGKLTLVLTDEGKEVMEHTSSLSFAFDMTAEAVPLTDSDGGSVDFGGTGKNFHFSIVDQPLVEVEKDGAYAELDQNGGELSYTVTTKVKHGQVKDVVLTDELTPPQNDAFVLDGKPENVTVKFRQKNAEGVAEEKELTSDDYVLVEVTDPDNPGKKTFQVKLKEPYASMQEGDEVSLTYRYGVKYNLKSAQKLWAEVANEATVTGNMVIKDPENPESGPAEKEFTEKDKNSVEMRVTPPGNGIVSKDQEYSELTNTLHYTLYTTVPAGTWTPMFIFDDMYVQYQGERWYFQEFLPTGRVKNLEVRAADLPADWFNGLEGATDAEKLEKLQKTIEEAKASDPLRGWQLDGYTFDTYWETTVPDYDPESMDEYVARLGGRELNVVFGYKGFSWEQWGTWGHWTITDRDRLIVTEYDLDMSTTLGDKITLVDMNDETRTIELSPEEILRAGITNNVRLHYGPYNPGYSVFFNNADEINKSGEVRKNGKDVYIDYTVTMNTTDESVRGYFHDVATDWYSSARKTDGEKEWQDWDYDTNGNVRAEFYDYLPEGWEYVEDSLYMTAKTSSGTERRMTLNPYVDLQLLDGDGNICAPLVFFVGDPGFVDSFVIYDSIDTIEIAFHYTLEAAEEWLAKNRNDDGVEVDNHAAIKDNKEPGERWSADNQEFYFPDKLTKDAEQVEGSNLLKFTLDINPDGEKFIQQGMDKAQSFLIVTDKSSNLQIQENTIKVCDESGAELNAKGRVVQSELVKNDDWKENEWGTLPPDEDGQFKLVVPNGEHLTVTYEAVITVSGDNVQVSNEAGIEGVERSKSNYEGSLVVSDIKSGGSASQYSLNFIKKDGNTKEGLAGAEFNFYVVLTEGSELDKQENKDKIKSFTIDGKTYRGYSDGWVIKTGDGGRFAITKSMNWLEPGSYYILEETEAPDGYVKLEKPILFYFGLANDPEAKTHPGAELAVPNGSLTVDNTPIQALRVVKKGSAGEDPFPLEGAQFQLCEAEKNGEDYTPAAGGKSYTGQSKGEAGSVLWDGGGEELQLEPGKYYILTETAAPDGYILVDGQIVLQVTEDGKLQVVSAPSEGVTCPAGPTGEPVFEIAVTDPSSYELPESGGAGTMMLYALGSALVLTAAMALVCGVRRRKTGG